VNYQIIPNKTIKTDNTMNTYNNKHLKLTYITPQIERLKLDNEISLVLQSIPPEGPGEASIAPEYFNNDPFKTNVG